MYRLAAYLCDAVTQVFVAFPFYDSQYLAQTPVGRTDPIEGVRQAESDGQRWS